jgi:glycerol-3-phosphate dehydrogenase (NAD(P)+)
MSQRVVILGAGSWGSALALAAFNTGCRLTLIGRDPARMARVAQSRRNTPYLPEAALPEGIAITASRAALQSADLIILATPFSGLAEAFMALGSDSRLGDVPLVWVAKGIDAATGELAHELAARLFAGRPVGVLSGPSFAREVAQNLPCALTIASTSATVQQAAVQAFHGGAMRVYTSDDMPGVEVGGAVKNVIAIAAGVCDGLSFGLNARAALITRGLAEMTRFAIALGGREQTLAGLTGLGDLVLTATGELSRNRRYGLKLAEGSTPAQLTSAGEPLAEGARCAQAVRQRAEALGIEMPITACVADIVAGRLAPEAAAQQLLSREATIE